MNAASKNRVQRAFYKYRVPLAFAYVLFGLVAARLDPLAKVAVSNLVAGFVLALGGILLRIWASAYVWPNIAAPSPQAREGMVTAGPYALVRNPIYLGGLLLVSGLTVGLGSPLAALTMLPPTLLTHYWQARYEESFLLSSYGKQFEDYRRSVPLLIPSPGKVCQERHGELDLVQGIKHDIGPVSGFLLFCILVALRMNYGSLSSFWMTTTLIGSLLVSVSLVRLVQRI